MLAQNSTLNPLAPIFVSINSSPDEIVNNCVDHSLAAPLASETVLKTAAPLDGETVRQSQAATDTSNSINDEQNKYSFAAIRRRGRPKAKQIQSVNLESNDNSVGIADEASTSAEAELNFVEPKISIEQYASDPNFGPMCEQ